MGQYCPVYFGLKYIRESYKRAFPAYYYSRTATYAPPTSGTIWWWAATSKIRNRESVATSTYNFWVTDISKNSALILNVSPKADGTIPEESAAYPPGDGVLTYGQRQGDLRHNSVDHRRR